MNPKQYATPVFNYRHPLIWMAVFGVLYVFLIPPFQSPDEPNHFLRAYQISEGHLFPEKTDARLGGVLPRSLDQLVDTFAYLKNNYDSRLSTSSLQYAASIALNSEDRQFHDFVNTAIYAPLGYLPQSLGIFIARIFGGGPLQMFYAARLFNFFAWLGLLAMTLRLLPAFAQIHIALGALPATLVMSASANGEILSNALCWYLIAYFGTHHWRQTQTSGRAHWLLPLLIPQKLITLPLVLLTLWEKTASFKKKALEFTLLCLVSCLVAWYWAATANAWFIAYDDYNPTYRDTQTLNRGVNPQAQLDYVMHHPVVFVGTVSHSLVATTPAMMAHFVGKFGWEKNYLPTAWIAMLWLVLLLLICTVERPLDWPKKAIGATVVIGYVLLFSVTMYALWFKVGANKMDNWQGRYFTAIAPLAALVIANQYLAKYRDKIYTVATLLLVLSNFHMLFMIWCRYWL